MRLELDRALYLASCSFSCKLLISIRSCWQLYLFEMYINAKNAISRNTHICLLMVVVVRMSPPRIFFSVIFFDSGASSSVAFCLITSLSVCPCMDLELSSAWMFSTVVVSVSLSVISGISLCVIVLAGFASNSSTCFLVNLSTYSLSSRQSSTLRSGFSGSAPVRPRMVL